MVTRWSIDGMEGDIAEEERGLYVEYRDYKALEDAVKSAIENFESMDRGMRNRAVPMSVAQEAFLCGMRDLRDAIGKCA